MSLQFSIIRIYDGGTLCTIGYKSGHPDEYGARDLIREDDILLKSVKRAGENPLVVVDHYDFDIWLEKEEPAEDSHFAIIRAYDEIAAETKYVPFINRDDIKHVGHILFSWKESEENL